MFANQQNGYLKANTILFAQRVCQSIEDMLGIPIQMCKETLQEKPFNSPYKMIAYITFSGSIQGNYLCSLDEIVALKLIGAYEEGMSTEQIRDLRQEYSGFIKEMLNLSVGQSIVELEKNFGDLTFSPSTVIFGEIEFPDILSGSIQIEGKAGKLLCGFSLNLANLKIGQKLEEALSDLEKKTSEAQEAQRNISSILECIPIGLATIDQTGTVLPGFSKSLVSLIDPLYRESIVGSCLTDILGVDKNKQTEWKSWLNLVFTKYKEIPFKDMAELCDLNEFENELQRILKLNWLPISSTDESSLDKLLVVIEDVTKQRELEKKMAELNQRHQENLELISQVINLGADEVTTFIYDSSQLLTDAQKIVESSNHDREFVNELFRTFHTLKGSSGQYRFMTLQEMAHKVEDYLKVFRDNEGCINNGAIEEIKHSIEYARGYISRIQDIRSKLGGKDETLKQKAQRDPSSVMVNLSAINDIRSGIVRIIDKTSGQMYDMYYIQELKDLQEKIEALRKIQLSFFITSLESLVKNCCEKMGKKAELNLGSDFPIDIEIVRKIHQCLIHIINNAISHGIEFPEERTQKGKIEQGVLIIAGKRGKQGIEISLEDDGQGIDLNAVREKISISFNIDREEVEQYNDQQLFSYLFKPGFTTKNEVSEFSGRGVGMDFVLDTVKKFGGDVIVESTSGKGTKVTLIIPETTYMNSAGEMK